MYKVEEKKCPYCSALLAKSPTRKAVCKQCGQTYYVKTIPADRQKVVVTEKEADQIEKEWEQYHYSKSQYRSPWTTISDEEFEQAKKSPLWQKQLSGGDHGQYDRDICWGIFNKNLMEAMKKGCPESMARLYYEMAMFRQKEGKDDPQLLQESQRCKLKALKARGFKKVKILSAGQDSHSCSVCQAMDGKEYLIEDALRDMPLPVKGCSTEVCRDGLGFCRCLYLGDTESFEPADELKDNDIVSIKLASPLVVIGLIAFFIILGIMLLIGSLLKG